MRKKLILSALLISLALVCCAGCAELTAFTTAATTDPSIAGSVPPLGATEYDATVGGVHLALRTGYVEVVGADASAASFTIPKVYEGLPVTTIAEGALKNTYAKTLHISSSVTTIGKDVFGGALQSITVDEDNANFAAKDGLLYNKAMTSLVFTPHVVGKVEIAEGILALERSTGVRSNGQEWYDGITELVLPASLKSISGSYLSLKSVTVSPASTSFVSVSGILYKKSDYDFAVVPPYVSGSITIPEGVTAIPAGFLSDESDEGNTRVTSVSLPSTVKSIGADAFRGCRALAAINFPSKLTTIGAGAFNGCALTAASLPASITSVAKDAFTCDKLTRLTVADGASGIDARAFTYREGQYIELTASEATVSAMGALIIDGWGNGDFDTLFYTTLDMVEKIIYTSGTTIGENTMQLRALREIVFPSGATKIADFAFAGCISLRKIVIPEGVTEIGARAFNGCPNLVSVTLPSTLTAVGTYAFAGTAIVSLTLPARLTSLGDRAFADLTKLIEVYNLSGVDIGSAASDAFSLGACADFVYTSAFVASKITTDANGYLYYNGEAVGYIGSDRVLEEK